MSREGLTINTNWQTYTNGGEGVAIGLDLKESLYESDSKEFNLIKTARSRVYGKNDAFHIKSHNGLIGLLAPVSCEDLKSDTAYEKLIEDIKENKVAGSTGVSFALNDLYHKEKEFKGNHEYRLSCVKATQPVYHKMLNDRGIIHFDNSTHQEILYMNCLTLR